MSEEAQARAARLSETPMRLAVPATSFTRGATQSLKDIWARRELLGMLVRRELRARYKDSSLGFIWSLIRPLVQLAIYYVAIGQFLGAWRLIPDFAIYVFTGLTVWQLFLEIVSSGTGSIIANGGIIKKTYLPREIFPLASVGSALVNFAVQFTILIVAALVIRGLIVDRRLLFIPLSVLVIIVWGTALALLLSAVNVYLRDVQYLVEVALMVGFWASPIVYSWEMVSGEISSALENLYLLNPVTLAVLGLQRGVWTAGADAPLPSNLDLRLAAALGAGLVAVALAQRAFAIMQRNFAQEL
ncbi:ABC transporter permease [Georgenia halophila]|uniref:Transport permease protein n=1 Tax=Georgenia halophila TaxID=620889 RepID=A0ABP8L2X1_9MICO